MRFKEFLNQGGAFSHMDEPTHVGVGNSLNLPTVTMDDLTNSVKGLVIDVSQENSSINKDPIFLIKVKIPSGIKVIKSTKKEIPEKGSQINVTIDRFGDVEDWNQ